MQRYLKVAKLTEIEKPQWQAYLPLSGETAGFLNNSTPDEVRARTSEEIKKTWSSLDSFT